MATLFSNYYAPRRKTPKRFAQLSKSIRLGRRRSRTSEFIVHARGTDTAFALAKEAARERALRERSA